MIRQLEWLQRVLPLYDLTEQLINALYIQTAEQTSLNQYQLLYSCLGIIHHIGYKKHNLQFLFVLVMALAYQDHANAQAVARRWRGLQEDFPELANLAETPTVHDVVTC